MSFDVSDSFADFLFVIIHASEAAELTQ